MHKVMLFQTVKNRIIKVLIFNFILIIVLLNIPRDNLELCLFKQITGNSCWNCGMTRAFLSILHFEFAIAINYNWKVVIVFPLTITIYLYSLYKYIAKDWRDTNEKFRR